MVLLLKFQPPALSLTCMTRTTMPTTRASASLSSEKDKDSSRGSPSNQVSESGEKKEATKDHPSNEHGEIEVVDWEGRDDPANPFNWSTSRKWVMTLTTCFMYGCVLPVSCSFAETL
jgi:hypothetical protein